MITIIISHPENYYLKRNIFLTHLPCINFNTNKINVAYHPSGPHD